MRVDLLSTEVAEVTQTVRAPLNAVWTVLNDGWLYPLWVLGASRMRAVDPGWPAVGTRLHHSVGSWPALIDDKTEVLITTTPEPGGTVVTIREDASDGPGRLVPQSVRQRAIVPRNREAMARFAFLVEGRHSP